MADYTPTLRSWPGPNRVGAFPAGLRIYDPPALGRWKGLDFLAISAEPTGGRSIAKIPVPYVPGQIVHDLGRKAWGITIRMLWIGDDWRARMENFVAVLDSQSSSGELALPDGGAVLTAHVETWSAPREYEDARDSAELTVVFAEDSRVDTILIFAASPTEGAVGEVPAGQTTARDAVENFRTVSADPDATDEEIEAAYRDADAALAAVEAQQDLDTVTGCDAEEGCVRSRGLMVESLDDPAILG